MALLHLPKAELPIRAAGFDVDGVMRDTGILAFNNCRKAIAELGGMPPEFADFVHEWGGGLIDYYRRCGVRKSDEEIRAVNERYLASHDKVGPFEDVAETLEHLETRDIRMFALSGHSTEKLQGWFEQHGLHVRFARVQGDGKDKTAYLRIICEILGVDPSQAFYVGDWAQDMRAAKEAGMIPIGISREHRTHHVLERNGALHVIDHLHELVRMVN